MRNEKGITLIALILIIVLFLILAVISVMLVINGEKENQSKSNNLVYNQQVFDNAYNEYTNSVVEDEGNTETTNTVENQIDANIVDENTVEPEATNTVTNEV